MTENMSAFDQTAIQDGDESSGFSPPEGWAMVAELSDSKRLSELGLVILAMGRPYWAVRDGEKFMLCVAEGDAEAVRGELDAYGRLMTDSPDQQTQPLPELYAVSSIGWLSYVAVIISFFIYQHGWSLSEMGRVDARLIVDHSEWWRGVTALSLHADVVHLVSNLVSGVGLAYLVARLFGSGMAWFLILLCGLFGNLMNAWIYYPEDHFSIGASTAVFGALGLLTGSAIVQAMGSSRFSLPKMSRGFLPLFAGVVLLGLWGGAGDLRVDVGAHLSGFSSGLLLGALCDRFRASLGRHRKLQVGCGVMTWFLFSLGWSIALGGVVV